MSNPQVPVTGPSTTEGGAVEVRGGESPVTFDELDKLTSDKKASKKAEKAEVKEEKEPQKSKDLTSDTDKGKKEPAKEAKAEKEDKAEAKEEKKEEIKRKTLKAKYQDNEYDLDEEAVFTVKINGKDELVTAKDLVNNFSGKTAWDKKFSELDKTRKGLSAKELKIQDVEGKVKSIFEEKDSQIRLYKMAELSGVNPAEFRAKYLEENINLLEKWYGMTEDQRKADALEFENQYLKHQSETQKKTTEREQSQKELRAKIDSLRAPHQISEENFVQRYEELGEYINQGKISPEQVNPEFIIETIVKDNLWNAANEKLSTLNIDWTEQARGENLLKLIENSYQLGLKPADMADIVDELWGKTAHKNKIEQKKKDKEEFLTGKKEVAQPRIKKDEPLFFDEI